MNKRSGLSLIEIMIALGVVAVLATMVKYTDFFAMFAGQPPNDSFREIARIYAPKMCGPNAHGAKVDECVKFGKSTCELEARKVIFRCTLQHKGSVPPLMSVQEQKLLMKVSARCIAEQWQKTIFQNFEIDLKNPKCQG